MGGSPTRPTATHQVNLADLVEQQHTQFVCGVVGLFSHQRPSLLSLAVMHRAERCITLQPISALHLANLPALSSLTCLSPTSSLDATAVSDSFTYKITDCNQKTATARVDLVYQPPPVATADSRPYTGQGFSVVAPGVLGNDLIAPYCSPGTVQATIATQARQGVVTLQKDGSYAYVPKTTPGARLSTGLAATRELC
jgi:hypothetical protein